MVAMVASAGVEMRTRGLARRRARTWAVFFALSLCALLFSAAPLGARAAATDEAAPANEASLRGGAGGGNGVFDQYSTECKTLGGSGSLNGECVVSASKQWTFDQVVTIVGPGNITVKENVTLSVDSGRTADQEGGHLNLTIGGYITLMPGAVLRAPSVILSADSLVLHARSAVNVSGLGYSMSGVPMRTEYGAGYGGTGAACEAGDTRGKGEPYGWKYDFQGVVFPFSQTGGGSASAGEGGGRIFIKTKGNVTLAGAIESNGLGAYAKSGGGGSGGSITIDAAAVINNSSDFAAVISASGGEGTPRENQGPEGNIQQGGGGGGGRISINCQGFDSSIQLQAADRLILA